MRSVIAGATLLVALTASPAAVQATSGDANPALLDDLGLLSGDVVPDAPAQVAHRRTIAHRRAHLERLRRDVRRAQRVALRRAARLGVHLAPAGRERQIADAGALLDARRRWRALARRLDARAQRAATSATTGALLCIHGYEGSWTANTGNGYYGGLQMDLGFQRAYGSDYLAAYGTADRWPPAAQLAAGARAVADRGFSPWPAAAAACGL